MTPAERVDKGLPVRASARPSDRNYDVKVPELSGRVDVILDDKVLAECASWDVVAGVVTRHRRDDEGKLILERGAPTFEELRGVVEVRWRRDGGRAA